MESVASVAEGLQEPGADPASDDRRRAGPRMETLAAGGHPTRGSEDTGAGVIITLTCADQGPGGVETTPSSQYWVPFILNNYY